MSNNFRKTAVLKKSQLSTKATKQRIALKSLDQNLTPKKSNAEFPRVGGLSCIFIRFQACYVACHLKASIGLAKDFGGTARS